MKIILVVGARPNFMKIAPILREMAPHPQFHPLVVHTGQHYDEKMSQVFFDDLHLPRPDINLEVGSGTHAQQTAQVMLRFEPVLVEHQPDIVLVVGDVNSTVACSLVAAKLHIPVAHVEAGLRSGDRTMPEEINRIVTDVLSDLLFPPTETAMHNLLNEGVPAEKIHFVGNVMVDSLLSHVDAARSRQVWQHWSLAEKGYALITLHRPANVDNPDQLKSLLDTILSISRQLPVLFPVHPRTRQRIEEMGIAAQIQQAGSLILAEPQGYLDFLCLLAGARLVLSDSGSIQAETTVLGVPNLCLRDTTEWPETITQGTNFLTGSDPAHILAEAERILTKLAPQPVRPPLWDGLAARRIVEVLLTYGSRGNFTD